MIPIYRPATDGDDPHVIEAFKSMLSELREFGHDILPTDYNVQFFWDNIFAPEIHAGTHGIVLAIDGTQCVGAVFIVPERTRIQTEKGRAVVYGVWVRPEWRRNGMACELQKRSHARMKDIGYKQIVTTVLSQNAAGLASCRKAGHKIIGVSTIAYL